MEAMGDEAAHRRELSRRQAVTLLAAIASAVTVYEAALRPGIAAASETWGHPFSSRREIIRPHGGSYPGYSPYPGPHRGADYSAAAGVAIHAVAAGTVVFAGLGGGRDWAGQHVFVRHASGHHSLYAHMRNIPVVSAGQAVSRGTELGVVGSTGQSDGPHLHIEIATSSDRYNDHIDPAPLIHNALLPDEPDAPISGGPTPSTQGDDVPVVVRNPNNGHTFTIAPGLYIRHHADQFQQDTAVSLFGAVVSPGTAGWRWALRDLGFPNVSGDQGLLPSGGAIKWAEHVEAVDWIKTRIGGSYTGQNLTDMIRALS